MTVDLTDLHILIQPALNITLNKITWLCHNFLVIVISSAIACNVISRMWVEWDTGFMCGDRCSYCHLSCWCFKSWLASYETVTSISIKLYVNLIMELIGPTFNKYFQVYSIKSIQYPWDKVVVKYGAYSLNHIIKPNRNINSWYHKIISCRN